MFNLISKVVKNGVKFYMSLLELYLWIIFTVLCFAVGYIVVDGIAKAFGF